MPQSVAFGMRERRFDCDFSFSQKFRFCLLAYRARAQITNQLVFKAAFARSLL